jgi:hypothetical protein
VTRRRPAAAPRPACRRTWSPATAAPFSSGSGTRVRPTLPLSPTPTPTPTPTLTPTPRRARPRPAPHAEGAAMGRMRAACGQLAEGRLVSRGVDLPRASRALRPLWALAAAPDQRNHFVTERRSLPNTVFAVAVAARRWRLSHRTVPLQSCAGK